MSDIKLLSFLVLTISSVTGETELNIILLRLVEYLGHTNPLVCGIAYNEVRHCSTRKIEILTVDSFYV